MFVALTVAWIMFPLLAGSDQSLDPGHLASLPLSRRDMVTGLFAASWVGAPPVATAILLAGAAAACWRAGAGASVVVADAVVMTVLAISTGRMVSAALAAAVRSRRGRDTASLVLAVVSAGSDAAAGGWRPRWPAGWTPCTVAHDRGACRWTPPARWPGRWSRRTPDRPGRRLCGLPTQPWRPGLWCGRGPPPWSGG